MSDLFEETLTYAELWARSEHVATLLRACTRRGDRVVLAYPTGLEFIVALFACFSAGAVAVPLPVPQPNETLDRWVHVCDDARPALVLSDAAGASLLACRLQPAIASRTATIAALADGFAVAPAPGEVARSELALLQYTSGSTAAPKGVMLSHANLQANLEQIRVAFGHHRDSVGVIWLPHFHDMGLIGGILQPLHCGFPVTLMAPARFLQRPLRWLETIARFRATTSGGPCFAFDVCVDRAARTPDLALDLSSWQVAFCGAEPIRAASLGAFAAAFHPHGFSERAFLPCYGLAEATLLVSSAPIGAGARVETVGSRDLVSSGRAAAGVVIKVVDPATGMLCGDGEAGEVHVWSPAVASGYWNQRDRLATTRLSTGDLGFLRHGELFIVGRLKDLIIVRGRNVAAEDVEAAVHAACPAAATDGCAAIAVDGPDGEELVLLHELGRRVLRTSTPDAIGAAVMESVWRHCGVVPRHYVPVHAGQLVRTSSGKVSRYASRLRYLDNGLCRVAPTAPTHEAHPETHVPCPHLS